MVLPNFVQRALKNEPIEVYGDGKQSRCFCDVRDTVEALLRLIPKSVPSEKSLTLVIRKKLRSKALARIVKRRTDSRSPIQYIPYEKAYEPGFEDMMRRIPSIEKLDASPDSGRRQLSWR